MTGRIHSFETFGTVDGPGIRFVVFMQGCPFRCLYCHNPDTWNYDAGKCFTVDEVVSKVIKYKSYFGNNGGITVTGGEPLVQIDFVIELFTKLHSLGINTCCDTSGALFDESNPELVEKYKRLNQVCDLYLLDIKHIDDDMHKTLTGKSNHNPLSFAKFLSSENKKMWIRHVLVPGITLNDDYLLKTRDFIKSLKTVSKVEVLPYHTMGINKYERLGIPYRLTGVNPPEREMVVHAKKLLEVESYEDR